MEASAKWAFLTIFSGTVALYFLYPFVEVFRKHEFHWMMLIGGVVPESIGIMSLVAMGFGMSRLIKHLSGRAEDSDFFD